MLGASTSKCFQTEFEKERFGRNKKMSIFLKAIYFFNLFGLLAGLTIVSIKQRAADYQCPSITVDFGAEMWDEALVKLPNDYYDRWVLLYDGFKDVVSPGQYAKWTLLFSYFNGVYEADGTHADRPIYRERRKFDRTPYGEYVVPAEIKYCEEISSWVFSHPFIQKKKNDMGCNWLLRSEETDEFDLLKVDSNWKIWTGVIVETKVSYACNVCIDESDCNMNGECYNGECKCNYEDGVQYLGTHCETKLKDSCRTVIGEENNVTLSVLYSDPSPYGDRPVQLIQQYGRPVYKLITAIGAPREDILGYGYTGSRWFGYVYSFDDMNWTAEDFYVHKKETHGFWGRHYDPKFTKFVSEPTKKDTPVGVDFYRIGKRITDTDQFGPFGELHPVQKYNQTGRGFFRCAG